MTLEDIKKKINALQINEGGHRAFNDELKQIIIDYHYENNIAPSSLAKELDITPSVVLNWKKKLGKDATAFYFGDSIRHDARTKALAVKEHNDGEKPKDIAKKYHVTENTIYNWIKKYSKNNEDLLNLPDGVPYLVPEENRIYGMKNIEEVMEHLNTSIDNLETVLNKAEEEGLTIGKTVKKEIESKLSKNKEKKDILEKAKNIIEQTK